MLKPGFPRPSSKKSCTRVACLNSLSANLYFLREFLVHYLQIPRNSIFRSQAAYSDSIVCHILDIPLRVQKEMELRVLFFNPNFPFPPSIAMRISLDYFYLNSCGHIQQPGNLRKQGGFTAIQICAKDDADAKALQDAAPFSCVWLLLNDSYYKQLGSRNSVDRSPGSSLASSGFFMELHFDLQVQEVFRMYGGNACPPSVN